MESATEYCLAGIQHWSMCLDKSQWASWVQAVGSVAAVFAAIALVWWERRDASAQRHAAASVVGQGMLLMLHPTLGCVAALRDSIRTELLQSIAPRLPLALWAEQLKLLALPVDEDLVRLSAAQPACAMNLVRACNLIRQAHTALGILGGGPDRPHALVEVRRHLENVDALLQHAHSEFRAAKLALERFCP